MKYFLGLSIVFFLFSCSPIKFIPCDCLNCTSTSEKPLIPLKTGNSWLYRMSDGRLYHTEVCNLDTLTYYDGDKENKIKGYLIKMYFDTVQKNQHFLHYYIPCNDRVSLVQINNALEKFIISGEHFLSHKIDTVYETGNYRYEYSYEKKVSIPAGVFDCVVVKKYRKLKSSEQKNIKRKINMLYREVHESTYYFSKEVGLIKTVGYPPPGAFTSSIYIMELLEYNVN